jgi:replicative superfamily II helicase
MPDIEHLLNVDILIYLPEIWDGISRNWNNGVYLQKTTLVIFDEIYLLSKDKGPVLEVTG